MVTFAQQLDDPLSLIRQLDPDAIRSRLTKMDAERKSLLILLRAALASKRATSCNEEKRIEQIREAVA